MSIVSADNSNVFLNKFNRQEFLQLLGIHSYRLSYLEQNFLVNPARIGKRIPLFSWEQAILVSILNLRLNLRYARESNLSKLLERINHPVGITNKMIVFFGESVYYLSSDWKNFTYPKQNEITQLDVVIIPLNKIERSLIEAGKQLIPNFETRFGVHISNVQ